MEQIAQRGSRGRGRSGRRGPRERVEDGAGALQIRLQEEVLGAPELLDRAQPRVGGRRGQPALDLRAVAAVGESQAQRGERGEAEGTGGVGGGRRRGRSGQTGARRHGGMGGPHQADPQADRGRGRHPAGGEGRLAPVAVGQQERAQRAGQREQKEAEGDAQEGRAVHRG